MSVIATRTGTTWLSFWNSAVAEEVGSGSVAPAVLRRMSSDRPDEPGGGEGVDIDVDALPDPHVVGDGLVDPGHHPYLGEVGRNGELGPGGDVGPRRHVRVDHGAVGGCPHQHLHPGEPALDLDPADRLVLVHDAAEGDSPVLEGAGGG